MVGLVAQDGAAGVVGDDSGDAHQPQADRPGLPARAGASARVSSWEKTSRSQASGLLDVFRTVLVCASGCLR